MAEASTRQQRRRLERERVKSGTALMSKGLPTQPKREQIRDIAAVLAQKLAEKDNQRRASEAAGLAQALNETSTRKLPPNPAIACKRGCAYCCYGFVGATPPEIFRLADAVRTGRAKGVTADHVARIADATRERSPEARVGAKIPCPMLVDGQCASYAERPLVCRQTTSLSLPSCLEEFEGRAASNDRIEVSSPHLAHASNAHVTLLGAMTAAGLPTTAYELASALAIALCSDDAEQRWLAGEPLFVNLPQRVKRPPEVEMVARTIAADLKL